MTNQNVYACPVMLKSIINAHYAQPISQDVTHVQAQINVIPVIRLFIGMLLQQLMANACAKEGLQKTINKFAYCVLFQDARTARQITSVACVTRHSIDSKLPSMASVSVKRLILRTQPNNVFYVPPQGV